MVNLRDAAGGLLGKVSDAFSRMTLHADPDAIPPLPPGNFRKVSPGSAPTAVVSLNFPEKTEKLSDPYYWKRGHGKHGQTDVKKVDLVTSMEKKPTPVMSTAEAVYVLLHTSPKDELAAQRRLAAARIVRTESLVSSDFVDNSQPLAPPSPDVIRKLRAMA